MEKIKSNQFGNELRNTREKQNISLRDCANLLNITAVRLHDFEIGNHIPTKEEFDKISNLLDFDFELEEYESINFIEISERNRLHIDYS